MFKDGWVTDQAATIRVVARKYGLDPAILAGVAWMEAGGMPDVMDRLAVEGRKRLPFLSPPYMTSGGDVSIQLRHVARQTGRDPEVMSDAQLDALLRRLEGSEAWNLDMVGQHLAGLRDRGWPDQGGRPLSDDQIVRLGFMYNVGYNPEYVDPSTDLNDPRYRKRSDYGFDLVAKIGRMKGLLDKNSRGNVK